MPGRRYDRCVPLDAAPPAPALRPWDRRARWLRGLVAVLLLLALGAPNWPEQIDDQFITLAFAHNWVDSGLVRWNTGAVVEGYSSFVQLVLAAGWEAIGGGDTNVFVKLLAASAGLGMALYANLRLPLNLGGSVLLGALVLWEPSARWSFVGMEASLYALLLTVGWTALLTDERRPAIGLGALLGGWAPRLARLPRSGRLKQLLRCGSRPSVGHYCWRPVAEL